MIELHEWLRYVRQHPLKFRFDGLHGRGNSRKSDFHTSVGEAAITDERFMDYYMNDEYDGIKEAFDKAIQAREDHDEILSRFVEFCERKVSHHTWVDKGLMTFDDWSKAPIESVLAVVDAFAEKDDYVNEYIRDWVMGPNEDYWDIIKNDDELIKEHPPIAVWYNAGEYEIPLKEVFFVCPACNGEPHTEEGLVEIHGEQNGYPYFYCGSCGSEMSVGKHEDIRDFFIAMDIEPYPFNPEKRMEWKKILENRKAYGDNKLELKVGDHVVLKVQEKLENGETYWRSEPGITVEVMEVRNVTENLDNGVHSPSGVVFMTLDGKEDTGFVRFHHIYSVA